MEQTMITTDIPEQIARVLILMCMLAGAAGAQSAKDVIESVQSRYDGIDDATITFSQSVRFKLSRAEQQTSGIMYFAKPNKYRIETDTRTVVTDGKTSWSYNQQNKQVVISRYKEATHSLSPEQILLQYPKDYFSTLLKEEKLGTEPCHVLKLTPRSESGVASSMKIWVTKKWLIRKVEITDLNGAVTTYLIKDLVIDKGIYASKFEFPIPAGAEVIDMR
jgi:outer membrane lipoprotein carrier protein